MSVWSFYNMDTGLFTGGLYKGPEDFLDVNTRDGCLYKKGEFDPLSTKVDLETGEVVEYIPEQPSLNHSWDEDSKRWVYVQTLEDKKAEKLLEIYNICSDFLSSIKTSYPPDEVQSWSKQEQEARNFLNDPTSHTPFLSALAEARGIDMDTLSQKVVAKADLFSSVSGSIIGKRQRLEKLIETAITKEEVELIKWEM